MAALHQQRQRKAGMMAAAANGRSSVSASRLPGGRVPLAARGSSASRLDVATMRSQAKAAAERAVKAEMSRMRPMAGSTIGRPNPSTMMRHQGASTVSKLGVPRTPARGPASVSQSTMSATGTPRGQMSARLSTSSASGRRMGADPLLLHGYQTLSPIANGAFSQIVRARHLSTQREVAVKTFHKAKYFQQGNEHLAKAMENELHVLKHLQQYSHPTIANILDVVDDPTSVRAMLEYCGGGSLKRLMAKKGVGSNMCRSFGLELPMCHSIAFQIATALAFIHGLGVVHRDLKPDNVLFVDDAHERVKLCDFGFAVACGNKRVRTVCGTPQYMAPEIAGASLARREPYLGGPCDIWAFGALVFEMLEGKTAFRGSSMEQLNMRIVRASHEAHSAQSPPPARSLIKKALEIEPLARLTAHEAVRHPWFAELRKSQLANEAADALAAAPQQIGEATDAGGAPAAVAAAEQVGDVGGRCVEDARVDSGRESIEAAIA